jgi:hypothetical protein
MMRVWKYALGGKQHFDLAVLARKFRRRHALLTIMGLRTVGVVGMPEIMIRCPNTNRVVPTGLTTEKIKLSSLSNLKLPLLCPACLKTHRWGQKEAWIYDRGKLMRRSH